MNLLYPSFQHDPATAFAPVALAARQTFMLVVHKDVPATDMPGLIAWLRREGAAVNLGAGTPGTTNAMAGELLKATLNLDFTIVPYRAMANIVQDLITGRTQMMIDTPTVLRPLVESGAVRALATTGAQRGAPDPSLPTMIEGGVPGFDVSAWQIIYVRGGYAGAGARHAARRRAATRWPIPPRWSAWRGSAWTPGRTRSPEAAQAHLRAEIARWAPLAARIRAG